MTTNRWAARFALAALVLSAVPALTLSPVGAAPAGPAPAGAAAKSWLSVKGPAAFSPNGDGRHDKARFKVKVKKRANVTLKVVRAGKVVRGPIKLGKRKAGSTVAWSWNGKNRKGKRVADAGSDGRKPYQIKVAARSLKTGKRVVVRHDIAVDTDAGLPAAARLVADSDTVYPQTTVVRDRLKFWVDSGESQNEAGTGTLVIRTVGGRKLREISSDRWARQWYDGPAVVEWNGKREDGSQLDVGGSSPWEGDVTARLRVEDAVGNVAQTPPITIRVSRKRLALKTAKVTIAPQRTEFVPTPRDCGPTSGNGCGESFPCGTVVPSTRAEMPLGLSYRARACPEWSSPSRETGAVARHLIDLPDDAVRGGAAVSVTMRGRATVDLEDDTARLTVAGVSSVSDASPDETTTTVTRAYDIGQDELYGRDGGFGAPTWMIETFGDDSYDVSEFDVTYAYLVPTD
ncbi:hypothetical protein [Nocardioides gilvus]|uniref:hypothetical protein n=1 Tax=Nocardioides gilvus TaxID=1735589 RepID=UPI0013A57E15|nr:hypothetical protein [Nocardioides gilvus]